MKNIFLISFSFCTTFSWGSNTIFYDAINGRELVFTATSRYEKLTVGELNPVEEVGYSFFTFQDEKYEEQRNRKIHSRFKRRPLEASFKQKADSLAQAFFQDYFSENNYYRNQKYKGYVVDRIGLSPISYLGNTLTFSFSASLKLNGVEAETFSVEEIYFLNLDDFSLLPATAIQGKVDYNALRKALVEKWQEIQGEMPNRNWGPLQNKVNYEQEEYGDEYEEEEETKHEPQVFYSDSLIGYGVQNADLKKAEIRFTGAGVLVVLKDAVPWFSGEDDTPLQVQLHLNVHEARDALRNFGPYQALQNATKPSPGKLPVDPKDFFHEAGFLRLTSNHLSFLRLEDASIYAIEKYLKNNPADSQYIHQINYKNGRAVYIEGGLRHDIPTYDSIVWKGDEVQAVIRQHAERNYSTGGGYGPERYLQLQVRDAYGNTNWYLTTENGFYMEHYAYFEGKVARYGYPILSGSSYENHYNQEPYWFEIVKMGLCEENGLCATVDERGRPVVEFKNYFAYDDSKLVQILGDQEASTLFYYDDSKRLEEVIETGRSAEQYRYFYKGESELPYRIEITEPNQSRSRNFYQIIHRH